MYPIIAIFHGLAKEYFGGLRHLVLEKAGKITGRPEFINRCERALGLDDDHNHLARDACMDRPHAPRCHASQIQFLRSPSKPETYD
jgi:hypothetical protein